MCFMMNGCQQVCVCSCDYMTPVDGAVNCQLHSCLGMSRHRLNDLTLTFITDRIRRSWLMRSSIEPQQIPGGLI